MDTSKLSPKLNDIQLKQNIDALLKGGTDKDKIQSYVNLYSKSADGNYVLKTAPSSSGKSGIDTSNMIGSSVSMEQEAGNVEALKNIGSDFHKRGQEQIDIIKNAGQEISSGVQEGGLKGFGNVLKGIFGGGIQTAGNVAGGVGDIFGEAIGAIVKQNHAVGDALTEATNKFMGMKNFYGETNAETIKKLQAFEQKHPEAAKDLFAGFNIGAILLGEKGAPEKGGVPTEGEGDIKTKTPDVTPPDSGPPDSGTKINIKEPGIKATLTPVKPDVKTSFKSLYQSLGGDAEKSKEWFSKLFSVEKAKVGNVAIDSPTAVLANSDLTEASSRIDNNIKNSITAKTDTIKNFGDTEVKGFTDETGKFKTVSSISSDFKNTANKLLESTVSLSPSQDKVYTKFLTELDSITGVEDGNNTYLGKKIAKNATTGDKYIITDNGNIIKVPKTISGNASLKSIDEFVDRWQNTSLGGGGTNSQKINAIINSTVHDINESAKVAADAVDGGAYRKANSDLSKLYDVKSKLEAGMGDKGAYTGKYGGAANFYAKAAGGDSAAKATLTEIEQASGIPLSQRANLAKFVETFGKKVNFSTVVADIPRMFITRFGKMKLYNDLISFAGDPEGAGIQVINKLDKASKGTVGSTIEKLSSEIESDSSSMEALKNAGLNTKQGAALIILGQLNASSGKRKSQ